MGWRESGNHGARYITAGQGAASTTRRPWLQAPTTETYPRSFPKGLIDLIAREEKIVPYLDMPLQHINDPVLKAMRRGTTGDTIRRRVAELRERVPGLALRTTLLVGYPGETEADFELLLAFIAEARFERMGAFAYSREEGTPREHRTTPLNCAHRAPTTCIPCSGSSSCMAVGLAKACVMCEPTSAGRPARQQRSGATTPWRRLASTAGCRGASSFARP